MADFKFSTIFTADESKFTKSTAKMKSSLKGLNTKFVSGEKDTKGYFKQLRKNNNMFSKMSKDANRASGSLNNLGKSFNGIKTLFGVTAIYQGARALGMFITVANDMVETANLFNVAMGSMATSTDEFIQEFTGVTGLDITNLRESVGTFSLLARSMGLADDNAQILSTNTAKLALDLSSLTNVPIQQVMQDLRSGLVGQSETVYKYGIDVTEASLKTEAMNQGITTSVRNMSQGEKMALRYSVMVRQTSLAQGDFAKTIETPANQLRILKERFVTASRSIGTIFVPALAQILPYANALVIVFTKLADTLASLFGYEDPEIENTVGSIGSGVSDLTDELDDSIDSANELSGALMGFDEINLLADTETSDSSVGTDSITGLDGYDLEGYDNGMSSITSTADELALKIEEIIGSFASLFSGVDPTDLVTSMNKLWESLEPFKEANAKGFGWFLDNVVVPLTEWTINKALPTTIDTITEALNLLATAISPVNTRLGVLWKKYFSPAVKFIGDAILTGLSDLKQLFLDLQDPTSNASGWLNDFGETVVNLQKLFIQPSIDSMIADMVRLDTDGFQPLLKASERLMSQLNIDMDSFKKTLILGLVAGFLLLKLNMDVIRSGIVAIFTGLLQGLTIFLDSFSILAQIGMDIVAGDFDSALKGILFLFINLWNSIAIGFEGTMNAVISMINAMIRRVNPILANMGMDTLDIIETVKFTVDLFSYEPTTYDPSAQYRAVTGVDSTGAVTESFTDNTADLLGQLITTVEDAFGATQDFIIKMDSTEVARATLPKLNKEASRQGYDAILQSK